MGVVVILLMLVGAVLLGSILYAITVYNGLVTVRRETDRAWANIDVLLKQRYDELPKLIQTVESYMGYEQATLKKVIEARNLYSQANNVTDKVEAANALRGALGGLFALAENYPDLKANQSFSQLQSRISGLEESIADRREYYNAAVNNYNIRIEQIPDIIVARMLNYQSRPLFQVDAADKQDVTVKIKLPQ